MRRGCATLVLFTLLSVPGLALAQTRGVEVGWRRMLEADFGGALAAFDEAERGTLSRAELIRSLEGRAHVHFALGDEDALDAALIRLAAIAPEHRLAPESPPELRERLAAHAGRGSITLRVTHAEQGGRARLEAIAEGDPGGMVRHVVVAARVGDAAWIEAEDEPLTLPVDPAHALAWYGEAIGPGGAVLARDGSRAAPHLRGSPEVDSGGGGDDAPWLWIGLGVGGAAVLGAVITIVLVSTTPPDTQPTPPMFM